MINDFNLSLKGYKPSGKNIDIKNIPILGHKYDPTVEFKSPYLSKRYLPRTDEIQLIELDARLALMLSG